MACFGRLSRRAEAAAAAAVGQLQFDVVQHRMQAEYGVETLMEPTSYNIARWAEGGWEAVDKAKQDGKLFGCFEAQDRWGRPGAPFPKRMEGRAAQRHGGRARPRSCAVCHWAPELEE